MEKTRSLIVCLFALWVLCGCPALIQSGYGVVVDQRKVGTMVSDEQIKLSIQQKLLAEDAPEILDISPYCYGGPLQRPWRFQRD
jgi:hypothetical protein